jgi:4-hydroxy-tetrahydrodipicolinate synthase
MERFAGLIPPMVTPVRDGQVDPSGIEALVAHTVEHLDGMVVAGSCGEGPSLSLRERRRAVETFITALGGRLPVIMGVAGTSLAEVVELVGEGSRLGVAGFLVPPPYYFRNSDDALRSYFGEVAKSTDREVMVYDNPNTTKTPLSVEVLLRLVEDNPNINHLKVTDTDIAKITALAERTDAALLAGSDEVMHHQVLRGCAGAVTAAPQVFPRTGRAWFDAAHAGDETAARRHYDRMTPFIIELLQGPDQYPAVVKLALHHLGVLPDVAVLPPLTPLDERRRQEVATVLDGHDLD